MQLILDLGNTNQKVAVFRDEEMVFLDSSPALDPERLTGLFSRFPDLRHSILSSVIEHDASMVDDLRKRLNLIILDEKTPVPVTNGYKTPATLGKDRLAAAVAGHTLFPRRPVLVVNSGTCITYDFVDADGLYHGGAISPGLNMRFRALHTFTGKLPLIDVADSGHLNGDTTESSLRAGVIFGITDEIEGFARRYSDRYPGLTVVLSGGDHNYFVKRLKISTFAVPNIVITGLHQILTFNAC
jgi:type III pantothenate kinase